MADIQSFQTSPEISTKKRKQEEEAPESKASKQTSLGWNSIVKDTMKKRTASDLLAQMKDGKVISVKSDDNMYTALLVFAEEKIHAVPVIDTEDANKCIGFIDTLDMVSVITDILSQGPVGEILFDKNADEDAELTASLIEQQVISSVSGQAVTDYSKVDHFSVVDLNANVLDIAQQLISQTKQRLAVQSHSKFKGVVTQFGFVEFATQEFGDIIAEQERKVKDITLTGKLVTTTSDTTAFEALQLMSKEKVNSVAIVNSNGSIVDVMSSSDLTLWNEWVASGQKMRFTDFSLLKDKIKEYLDNSRAQRDIPKRHPITCTKESKLGDVMSDMLFHNIHHIFVVDEVNRPTGVLGFVDFIRDLIN